MTGVADAAPGAGGRQDPRLAELVEFIARALVDEPEAVEVEETAGDQTSVLELTVAEADVGKVIGKQGRTAQAIRTLLSAVSEKHSRRAVLEILD